MASGYELLDPASGEDANCLQANLGKGWLAMMLEKRKETAGHHWVVAAAQRNGEFQLVDSLTAESPSGLDPEFPSSVGHQRGPAAQTKERRSRALLLGGPWGGNC